MVTAATNAMRNRNMAVASMIAVVTAGWLLFRAQSPNKQDVLYSEPEKRTMAGQEASGSDANARAPSREH